MDQPTTSRGNFAVILATASITLALGVTTAALTGSLAPRRSEPEANIAPVSDAEVTPPATAPTEVVPSEVMPTETQLAWVEPGDDGRERGHRDDDDEHEHEREREHGDDDDD